MLRKKIADRNFMRFRPKIGNLWGEISDELGMLFLLLRKL